MKVIKQWFFLTLLLLATTASAAPAQLNYQHFAHLPMVSGASVSPDGKYIAAIYQNEKGPAVVVAEFGSTELATVARFKEGEGLLEKVEWINSQRLLITSSFAEKYGMFRWRSAKYYAVNYDGSNNIVIEPKIDNSKARWMKDRARKVQVISSLPSDDQHILVQGFDLRDKSLAVYKVNINDSRFDQLFINKHFVNKWVHDQYGKIKFGYGFKRDEPNLIRYWHRTNDNAEWTLVKEATKPVAETFKPLALIDDNLYVLSNRKTGKEALWTFNPATAEYKALVYQHPKFDITDVLFNLDRSKVLGVSYIDHHLEHHYFDEHLTKLDTVVNNSIFRMKSRIVSADRSGTKWLVESSKLGGLSKYFWFDYENKTGGAWLSQYPYLEGRPSANKHAFSYTARDGMSLNGYITLPANVELDSDKKTDKSLPLVVMPHGDLFGARDDDRHNYLVQFIANLGYAVLQPKYRGSGGYGNDYLQKGYKQLGLTTQTDVYDAIEWVKNNTQVDVSNTCIMGRSYGAFIALTAAYQQPSNYQCVVSISGLSDAYRAVDEGTRMTSPVSEFLTATYGDLSKEQDTQHLKAISPINAIDKIKTPMLMIHGTNDMRVYYNQSADFYKKAKAAGKDIEYLELKFGTHFLDENKDRLEAFKAIEAFLTKHLKV